MLRCPENTYSYGKPSVKSIKLSVIVSSSHRSYNVLVEQAESVTVPYISCSPKAVRSATGTRRKTSIRMSNTSLCGQNNSNSTEMSNDCYPTTSNQSAPS